MAWPFFSIFAILRRRFRRRRRAIRRRAHVSKRSNRLPLLFLAALSAALPVNAQPGPDATIPAPERLEDYQDLWTRGEYADALLQLNEMIATMTHGVPARYLFDRAELHFLTGRLRLAVQDMEILCRQISAPIYTLRLAEYYRSLGKQELFLRTLEDAARQADNRWFYGAYEDNVVAMARIGELQRENPRTILRTLLDPLIEKRPDYVGAYIAAGELSLAHDDYALAAEYFERALEVDEADQAALAGLARAFLASNDPRSTEVLERLRSLNPNRPELIEIDSELLIRSGKYEESLERINEGLQINPVHSRLLGLKAAALFFLDRTDELEAVQREALQVNSRNSEIFRIPGEMASSRLRITEAVDFLERALIVDPEDEEAEALLGFALLDRGKDAAARLHLEKAFESDPYDVRVYNVLEVLDTLDRFATVERGDFRLSLPSDEADILANEAFELLSEGRVVLGEKYDVELEPPVVVQMFDHHDDFIVRALGFPGAVGYLGLCTGQLITMGSPSAHPPGYINWRLVLWHEFTHIVTLQKTRNRMPRWLSEGISGYEERQRDPAWGERAAVEYKQIYAETGMPRLHHLEQFFIAPESGLYLSYGYFLSAEFIDYYVSAHGMDALNRALEGVGEGRPTETMLAEAAGQSLESVNSGFAEHLRQRFRKFDNLPEITNARGRSVSMLDEGTSVTLENQDWGGARSPFTDALNSGARAIQEERWADAEMQLKRAHELYPEYQGADAPLRLLIDLYDRLGRTDDLRDALELQVSSSATDLSSYVRYARLLKQTKDWEGSASVIERAFGIDPFDPLLRRMRVESAIALGQTDVALQQLAHLRRLDAPHAADYQLQRVRLLMADSRWREAHDEVFQLLEQLPYFWEAQEALLRIIERDERELGRLGEREYAPPTAEGP